jgi:hypothetical protein
MTSVAVPPLLSMSQAQLDQLYRHSPPGEIPDGAGEGAVLFAAGTPLARVAARFVWTFFWQGKVFDRERGELRNRVTIFRMLAVKARVYPGPSRLDGGESIILDYSRTSLLARWVRDEIREVAPGVYLGLAYLFGIRVVAFALVFS